MFRRYVGEFELKVSMKFGKVYGHIKRFRGALQAGGRGFESLQLHQT